MAIGRVWSRCIPLLALAACRPSTPPDEPDVVVIESIDAAAIRDSGDTSACGVFCAHLAMPEPPCREATGACIPTCRLGTRPDLAIIPAEQIECVSRATNREEIRACGAFCR